MNIENLKLMKYLRPSIDLHQIENLVFLNISPFLYTRNFSSNYKTLSKLEQQCLILEKFRNIIKSERFDGVFLIDTILNVLEH